MSTINEALKKAQKERDDQHLLYGAILSSPGGGKLLLKKRFLPWLVIPALVIIGALAADAWLETKNNPPPAMKAEAVRPVESLPSGEIEPSDPPAGEGENMGRLYERARSFHGEGRLELARRFYLEVLRIDPGYVNAINNLGVICLAEKDFGGAEDYFNQALTVRADSVDPYYNLACLYALTGDTRRGLDSLKKAIQLDQTAREWARKDNDLDGLRESPEFDLLIDGNN